jgi:hypothetical protein
MHRAYRGRPVQVSASERGSRSITRTRPRRREPLAYQGEELAALLHLLISLFQPGQRTVAEVALSDEALAHKANPRSRSTNVPSRSISASTSDTLADRSHPRAVDGSACGKVLALPRRALLCWIRHRRCRSCPATAARDHQSRADAGTRPGTYRLQDSPSTLTMAATSDFTVFSDRFGDYSGVSGREFVSQVVSRRHDAVIYG